MRIVGKISLFVLAICVQTALGAVMQVDIGNWYCQDVRTADDGWQICSLDYYADGCLRFNALGDYAVSPVFDAPVVRVWMEVKSTQSPSRFLTLTPVSPEAKAAAVFAESTSGGCVLQEIRWQAEDQVRQIRFSLKGSGAAGWGVRSLIIETDDGYKPVAKPENLRALQLCSDAAVLAWDADASRYQIEAYRIVETPASYKGLSLVDLSVLSNTSGSYVTADLTNLGDIDTENVFQPPGSVGMVSVGNTQNLGVLRWRPGITADNVTLLIRTWKHPNEEYARRLSASAAGVSASLLVPFEPTVFAVGLGTIGADDVVCLQPSAKARVYVDRIELVSEYSPAVTCTNLVQNATAVGRCERAVTGLTPGELLMYVRAQSEQGYVSSWSDPLPLKLDPSMPKFRPDGIVIMVR